ncbi:MAG: DUF342 domain-containing protein, partial [Actinomycetia bacterium]|nr:DUF342 domain-containing protein [Actinomycetes bacterium]
MMNTTWIESAEMILENLEIDHEEIPGNDTDLAGLKELDFKLGSVFKYKERNELNEIKDKDVQLKKDIEIQTEESDDILENLIAAEFNLNLNNKSSPAKNPEQSFNFKIFLSADDMKCYISLFPGKDLAGISEKTIFKKLKKEGIVYNINRERVRELVNRLKKEGKIIEKELIAEGNYPDKGSEDTVEISFKKRDLTNLEKTSEKKQFIEYYNQRSFGGENRINRTVADIRNDKIVMGFVKEQEKLLKILPGKSPEPGYTVKGEKIEIIKNSSMLPVADINVVKRGADYYSLIKGKVVYYNNIIRVFLFKDGKFEINFTKNRQSVFLEIIPHSGAGKPVI